MCLGNVLKGFFDGCIAPVIRTSEQIVVQMSTSVLRIVDKMGLENNTTGGTNLVSACIY